MEPPKRVFVVDDHPIVRDGIAQLVAHHPDLCVCGDAMNIASARDGIRETRPDVVIVDLSLGRESGLDLIESLCAEHGRIAVLALSMHDEGLYAKRALRAGARGYIMKQEATNLLLHAIRTVLAGEVYVSSKVNASLLRRLSTGAHEPHEQLGELTDRELQIYRLVGDGVGTRGIAQSLHLSTKTVDAHRAKIKQKLGLATATELVVHAAQHSATTGARDDTADRADD